MITISFIDKKTQLLGVIMRHFILIVFILGATVACAQTDVVERILSSEECAELGGEIINTLAGKDCGENEYLGEVTGMECPCICCMKKEGELSHGSGQ